MEIILIVPSHCSAVEVKESEGMRLSSWPAVVTNVSAEMGSLMKTLRCLFQRGLAPQSSVHASLKK